MLLSKHKHGFLVDDDGIDGVFRPDDPAVCTGTGTTARAAPHLADMDEGYSGSPVVERRSICAPHIQGSPKQPEVWPPPSCEIAGHCTVAYSQNSPYPARRLSARKGGGGGQVSASVSMQCTHQGHIHRVLKLHRASTSAWQEPPTPMLPPASPPPSTSLEARRQSSLLHRSLRRAQMSPSSSPPPPPPPPPPLPDDVLPTLLHQKVLEKKISADEAELILRVTHLGHAAVELDESFTDSPPRSLSPSPPPTPEPRPRVVTHSSFVVCGKVFLSVGTSALGNTQYRRRALSKGEARFNHDPRSSADGPSSGPPRGLPRGAEGTRSTPPDRSDLRAASSGDGELTPLAAFPPTQGGWARRPALNVGRR